MMVNLGEAQVFVGETPETFQRFINGEGSPLKRSE
jgi:hypothetical protein